MKIKFCLVLALLGSVWCAQAQQAVVRLSDLGLQPNTRENAVPYIAKGIDSLKKLGGGTLQLAQGRYDLWPHKAAERNYHQSNTTDIMPQRIGVMIEQARNITIEGNGAMLVPHDRMIVVAIDRSSNIELKDFSADWDIPLTAEGVVQSVDETGFTITIDTDQFPFEVRDNRLLFLGEGWSSYLSSVMEFTPEKWVRPGTGDVTSGAYGRYAARQTSPNTVRFDVPAGKPMPVVGHTLVLRHSERDHAGIFVQESQNISFQDVKVHHTAGLGILCQYSTNLRFLRSGVFPNPAKKRTLSGHDDGFHIMGCNGTIEVDSCLFGGLMDDPINIHGTCAKIIKKIDDKTVVCRMMHSMSEGLRWGLVGDVVSFIEPQTMRSVSQAKIVAYQKLSTADFQVTLSEPLPEALAQEGVLENLTWTPSAVTIKNSRFESCRARGLLLSIPSKVLVENNYFASSGSAILIPGDANGWYESGAVTDLTIKGNTFDAPCMTSYYQFCQAVISIEPEIPNAKVEYPFHRNIRIEDNTFHLFDYPVLYAKSVDGLTFSNNTLIRNNDFKPFHRRKAGITLEFCKDVTISGNKAQGDVLGRTIVLEHTRAKEVKLGRGSIFKIQK